MVIIGVNFLLYRVDASFQKNTANDFSYAIKTAAQDATKILINKNTINRSYNGNMNEFQDMIIDFDDAEARFYKTLYLNLGAGSKKDLNLFSNMNIPLTGVVGYRYIVGKLYNGEYTFPYAYTWYDKDNERILNFTLGKRVYIKYDRSNTESIAAIDNLGSLMPNMTNEEFRNYIVISRINEFLTKFSTDKYNLVSKNIYKGLNFQLAHTDQTDHLYSEKDAVIDGVGFFAVLDYFTGSFSRTKKYQRIFSFGGSELLRTDG